MQEPNVKFVLKAKILLALVYFITIFAPVKQHLFKLN